MRRRRQEQPSSKQAAHTRTPSSERQFDSLSEGCSKEGSSEMGKVCRHPCCISRHHADTSATLLRRSGGLKPARECQAASEDTTRSSSCRHSSTASADDEKRDSVGKGGGGGSTGASDEADEPKQWKTFRDKDYTKLRNVERISFNGAQIWRERGTRTGPAAGASRARLYSGTDSGVSPPPRRSLRSLTPDDDSISFHESLGRELDRRRRSRRRSASASSRCREPAEGEADEKPDGRRKTRLGSANSANSNQSMTGASSRNSSSKSEKSSSRSSRSPSVDLNKKGAVKLYFLENCHCKILSNPLTDRLPHFLCQSF